MNIFVTSPCPIESAKALDDKRVIKMCSESVQMICTALSLRGVSQDELPMKPTHVNHPCNIWVRSSQTLTNYCASGRFPKPFVMALQLITLTK